MAVLCKLSREPVGYRVVEQADRDKDAHGCYKAAVVTDGACTRQADEGARALGGGRMADIA